MGRDGTIIVDIFVRNISGNRNNSSVDERIFYVGKVTVCVCVRVCKCCVCVRTCNVECNLVSERNIEGKVTKNGGDFIAVPVK